MASAFAHALAAVVLGKTYPRRFSSAKFWILGVLCTILPDADVVMFKFGVPYGHMFGHRGFTHSLVFALLLGITVTGIFYGNTRPTSKKGMQYTLFFALCSASHILLDALTNGGLGVAIFAPFSGTRYFLPWRPIQVSPIGVSNFFSVWGWRVIKSELLWVGIPSALYILAVSILNSRKAKTKGNLA